MEHSVSHITLAVLAGGEGARMGRPKAELIVGGVPILRWLLERWSWGGPTMLVTAPRRENPAGADLFTREVSDPAAGQGPLRGLLTALENARTPILVIATCDMPLVEARQLHWLGDELLRRRAGTWMVMTRPGAGEELEPFPCAIRRAAKPVVAGHLASGARSLHSLAALAGVEALPSPPDWSAETYTNLNRPGEYEAFERTLIG